MAKLELPAIPLKIKLDEANELIQEELDANNWGEVEVPLADLELVSYYIFNYDSYSEAEEEGTKIRNVNEATQGTSSLNAVKNTLDEIIAEMVHPELVQKTFDEPPKVKVHVKNPRFNADEAKGVAQIKIAAQEKVPRANVHVHGLYLVYVPFWVFKIVLDEDNEIKLRVNAVSGEFEGDESGIPYQGNTATDLARETLSDLRSPEGWATFIQNMVKDVILLFQPQKEHPNRWLMIILLVLVALFLLALGFINWPTPK